MKIALRIGSSYAASADVRAAAESAAADPHQYYPVETESFIRMDPLPDTWKLRSFAVPFVKDDLPAGVYVVYGTAGSGKTYFMRERVQQGLSRAIILPFMEPELSYGVLPQMSTEVHLETLVDALTSPDYDIIGIDSWRTLVFDLPGSTTTKGISTGTFKFLTAVDLAAKANGKLVFVVINPQINDPKFVDEAMAAIEGSVSGLIKCTSITRQEIQTRADRNSWKPLIDRGRQDANRNGETLHADLSNEPLRHALRALTRK